MRSSRNYEILGREVRIQVGDGPGPERREHVRSSFREMTVAYRHRPPRRIRPAMTAAAVLLIGITTFTLLELSVPRPLAFWVGSETRKGEEGTWLQASVSASLPVRFEDGTRVELREESTGRVVTANHEKVRIELGRGRLKASINRKRTRSRWTVAAGPYRVTALGTEFSVVWKTSPNALDVRVFQGRVRVRGPGLLETGQEIGAGEFLTLRKSRRETVTRFGKLVADTPECNDADSVTAEKREREEAIRVAKLTLPPRPVELAPGLGHDEAPDLSETKVASLDDHRPESWQELYDLRRYTEAFAAAGKLGFGDLVETLDDRELWQLADVARLAGEGIAAKRALLSLRKRFRDSWRATIAAFLLGRVSVESLEDPRSACNWFWIYLNEDPGGRLAEEALGRSIGACDEAGMSDRAEQAARAYLENHQGGTFSERASKLLSGKGG